MMYLKLRHLLCAAALVFAASTASAQTFVASTDAELRRAIADANDSGGTIVLTGNITLLADLPSLTANITFDGGGFTLSGANQYRGLIAGDPTVFSGPPPNTVTIQNLTIANAVASGSAGQSSVDGGGGGGGGIGGAIVVATGATVVISNVNITGSGAAGGAGGGPSGPAGGGAGGDGIGPFFAAGGTGGANPLPGGYAGGGGGGLGPFAAGGFAAGSGSGAGGGGGGGALGGAIFVQGGGILTVTGGLTVNGGTVTGGFGAAGAGNGSAFGSGLFLGGTGTFTIAPAAGQTVTIGDAISDEFGSSGTGGSWGVTKTGAGTLVLTGSNTYAGGTDVLAGAVDIRSSANLGGGTVLLHNGATLTITGSSSFAQALGLDGAGVLGVAPGQSVSWSGPIQDNPAGAPGRLDVTGGGSLFLANVENSYSSGTTIRGGSTVQISADSALGDPAGALTLGDATTSGTLSFVGLKDVSSRAIAFDTGGATIDITGGSDLILTGTLSGSGGVTKAGAGVLTLSGTGTYAGPTTVSAGVLRTGSPNIFGSTAGLSVASGATLDLNGFNQAAGALSGGGLVTLGSAVLTIGGGNADSLFSGVLSGAGSLVKTGTGTLTLNGANSYTGGTTIAGGVLRGTTSSLQGNIFNNAVLAFDQTVAGTFFGAISGPGAVVKDGGGVVTLTGVNTYLGGTTVNGGTLSGTTASLQGNITNNAIVAFDQNVAGTYRGVMSGTGAVTKAGAGTLVLGRSNTYTGGTTVSGGVLQAGATNAFGTGAVAVNFGAWLDLAGFSQSLPAISGRGNVALGTATLTLGAGGTSSTVDATISGPGSLVKEGGGTLTLTAANSYTGGTSVLGGTLIGTTASLPGNIRNNSAVVFDQRTDGTYAGTMTGTGVLEKAGSGVLTVIGSLAHTGGTLISGGSMVGTGTTFAGLVVNNGSVTFAGNGSSPLLGTLAGSGDYLKLGTGTLSLTGTHPATGTFAVNGGTLSLDGIFGGNARVGPAGTFVGTGIVLGSVDVFGTLVVPTGSTPAPIATAATLTQATGIHRATTTVLGIGRDLTFNPGASLTLPVAFGDTPTLAVDGRATFNGATIQFIPLEIGTQRSFSFLALSAANGLIMNNTTAISSDALLVPYLRSDAKNIFVTMTNLAVPLATAATSASGAAVAAVIDRFKTGASGDGATVVRELSALNDHDLNDALRQISGEAHASLLQFGVRESEQATDSVRDEISARHREARMGAQQRVNWWTSVGGEHSRLHNPDGSDAGVIDMGNGMGGVDWAPSSHWILGGGGGFASGGVSISDLKSQADVKTPRAFAYAGYQPKGFGLRGGLSFARQKSNTTRQLLFVARLPEDLGGGPIDGGIDRIAASIETAVVSDQWGQYNDELDVKTYTYEWNVGIRRAEFARRAFTETGADSLSLLFPDQTLRLRQADVAIHFWRREKSVRPFGEVLYRRETTNGRSTADVAFADLPGSDYQVTGLPAPINLFSARGGTTLMTVAGALTFEYQYRHSEGQTTHRADVRLRFK